MHRHTNASAYQREHMKIDYDFVTYHFIGLFVIICFVMPNLHLVHCTGCFHIGYSAIRAASLAEWVRSLYFSALNHSTISPLYLVQVRAPHWPHVRQAKFCLRVCQVVFPGYSRFVPPIDWLVSMSKIILKGTLN